MVSSCIDMAAWRSTEHGYLNKAPFNETLHIKFDENWPDGFRGDVVKRYFDHALRCIGTFHVLDCKVRIKTSWKGFKCLYHKKT